MDGRGEQPLCHGALCPRTRAALGDPQPSLGAAPELSELPGTAQLIPNPQTVRNKPKGCHNCPRPQPLEPPDHLLRCWVLSARTHLSLGGTDTVPGVPHRAWQGEGRVQAAAPTDLSILSTPSPGPTSAQALSSSVHSTRGVLAESFLAVRPAVPSARAQGHKPAAPRLLCSPSRSPRRCLGWICPGLWDRSLLATQLLEVFQACHEPALCHAGAGQCPHPSK